MRVFRDLEHLPAFRNAVITIGTFDGVHKGHQKLLERINTLADSVNGESVIITFHPHPRQVINPGDNSLKILTSTEEKIHLLGHYGVDNVVVVPFSRDFSEQNAENYIQDFLVGCFQPSWIVIGYDHRFGKDRSGNFDLLEKCSTRFGYRLDAIPKEMLDNNAISSTSIRKALNAGSVEIAAELLGHSYSLSGIVVKGLQNGRKLGYPTANIQVNEPYKLIPGGGIYAVLVKHQGRYYKGMMSIGFNPTFNGKQQTLEVNILDFDKDIYGEILTIDFIRFLRHEQKFDSIDRLIEALANDKKETEKVLVSYQQYLNFTT